MRQAARRIWLALSACLAVLVVVMPDSALTAQPATGPGGIGASGDKALYLSVVLAALVIAAVAVAMAWRQRARSTSIVADFEQRLHTTDMALSEARAVLAAEPHLLFVWRDPDDPTPAITGQLPGDTGVPAGDDDRLDFPGWLAQESAVNLAADLANLTQEGRPFNLFLTTKSGNRLVGEGFPVGAKGALKLRPLLGASLDQVEAKDEAALLRVSLESFEAALADAPVLSWLRNNEGQVVWVNNPYARAVEAENPAAVVAQGAELLPAEISQHSALALSKGETSHQRAHIIAAGDRRTFEIFETPAPCGSAGLAVDVTALEHANEELARHIAAHASTLDQIATAVVIFGADQRLTFFNSAYIEMWGLDENWLAQKPMDSEILDYLREQSRLPEQADYHAWRQKRHEAFKKAETEEDWWHLPDGRSLRVVCEPHPFGGVTYLFENVTEELALKTRFNALNSVQRETLDNLHEGVALFGPDGRLRLSNPVFAEIWHLDPNSLEREPHMDRVIEECRRLAPASEHWDELRECVIAFGQDRRPIKGQIERSDAVVIDYASIPLPDGGTLFTYIDVSDSWRIQNALRDRNEALLAADQLKTRFINHVSYELRAPLTSIMGFADLIASQTFGSINPKQREYIEYIQHSSTTLHQLINDILDLATIDAGVMELELSQVDISAAIRSTAALLEKNLTKATLVLEFDIDADAGSIIADETRVKQVLYNLLTNAIGFSQEGGQIILGASRSDTDVRIWVGDEGSGIEDNLLERVFDRFETHTGGTAHRGSGLGLSIVKSLIELHSGSIDIDTEPGRGTVITCRFPLTPPPPQIAATSDREHGPGAAISASATQPVLAAADPAPVAGRDEHDSHTSPGA
ncbi:MAG: ATP-binding protein [Alphaproteobacteria bacterium]